VSARVEFTDVRGPALRYAGLGLLAVAALWRVSPVHPPLVCPLRETTGIPCPFCGMTRAVVAAVHGDVLGSLRFNPAGLLVLALVAFVIVRARLPLTRAPAWIVFGFLGALWIYNLALNPTF
jgi:hypothetical protein